jgi:predicted nucleic acid-binding protein
VGQLTLPASGEIYLDANTIIYSYERIEPYRTLLEPCWDAPASSPPPKVTSVLTLMEVMIKPLRTGNTRLEAGFRDLLLNSADIHLLPITIPILERAARLRADYAGLKTPDAIHAATALEHSCALFLTNDPAFRRIPGLPATILSDLLPTP